MRKYEGGCQQITSIRTKQNEPDSWTEEHKWKLLYGVQPCVSAVDRSTAWRMTYNA